MYTKFGSVDAFLRLTYFPNSPEGFLALVRIVNDNGDIVYDGQMHLLYYKRELRHILDMTVLSYIPRPESMNALNWICVKS